MNIDNATPGSDDFFSPCPRIAVSLIVQARMGSRRFPGKMLAPLGKWPLLQWVLHRVQGARTVQRVVLAIPEGKSNLPLAELANALRVPVVTGPEGDVLGRFLVALKRFPAKTVVRVCADNPFVSPEEIDRLVLFFQRCRPDYAFNHVPRLENQYPDGLGAEILSYRLLQRLEAKAISPWHREHVTSLIWDHPLDFRIAGPTAPIALAYPWIKLDVDTAEDLERLQKLDCIEDIDASADTVIKDYLQHRL